MSDTTFNTNIATVAWEACRAWDAIQGTTTAAWADATVPQQTAFIAAVVAIMAGTTPAVLFASTTWEVAVKDRLIRGVTAMAMRPSVIV